MWRLVSIPLIAMALAVATHAVNPSSVQACSVGPDFDPVADSDLIVEGTIIGFETLPPVPADFGKTDDPQYTPIRVDMAVARTIKGPETGTLFSFEAPRSLPPPHPERDELRWIGSSGQCGTFSEDPTGKHAIMGLTRHDGGRYSSNGPLTFFLADAPQGDGYNRAIARLGVEAIADELPSTGAGTERSDTTLSFAILAGAVASASLATGAFALRAYRKSAA